MNIYVVEGTCGEYSDRDMWSVRAFTEESKAQEWVTRASDRARELYVQYEVRWDIPEGANEFDPHMQTDYTGTSYFYYAVPLEGELK